MTCHEFQSALTTAVEARDRAALERLALHVRSCPSADCRQAWRVEQLLTAAVAAWRTESAPPPRLAARVLRQVLGSPAPTAAFSASNRSTLPRRVWPLAGAAAALLLMGLVLLREGSEPQRLVTRAPSPRPAGSAPHDRPAGQDAGRVLDAAQLGGAYVGMAHEAAWFVTDLAMLVVPVRIDDPAESPAGGAGWLRRIEEGIEPVREGVSGKLDEWFAGPAT